MSFRTFDADFYIKKRANFKIVKEWQKEKELFR